MFDTETLLQTLANAARSEAESLRGFAELDRALARSPGHKLFTVLAIDLARAENRRMYSSAPDVYPPGGAKPLRSGSEFYREVVSAGRSRLCRTRQECQAAFSDFALIEQLGCESAINVPVRSGGVTLGTLNLLHAADWYTVDMIPALERLALHTAPLLLRSQVSPPPLSRQLP